MALTEPAENSKWGSAEGGSHALGMPLHPRDQAIVRTCQQWSPVKASHLRLLLELDLSREGFIEYQPGSVYTHSIHG
ncbi:hypothetical protein AN958_09756 [Leucoagaricus sp. SymC.cos]|nr:hypothetical protein AN958_09756 [Leucoagaricus sp. SymC.cos]